MVDTYLQAFQPKPDVLLRRGQRGARRQGQDERREILAHAAPGISGLAAGARAQAQHLTSMDETAAPAPAAAPRSIGERLRAGRERSGLSVAAAAEKLHLDSKVIEALEADRFAELGASVYVRGHLRRYADFVGEPGAELVEQLRRRAKRAPPPPDLTQVPQAERRADPRRLVTPLVGLACAAVLLLAIWWVLAGSRRKQRARTGVDCRRPCGRTG